jgi:hypothetical protein
MNEVLEVNNQLASKKLELTEEKMQSEKDRTGKFHSSVLTLLKNLASLTERLKPKGQRNPS